MDKTIEIEQMLDAFAVLETAMEAAEAMEQSAKNYFLAEDIALGLQNIWRLFKKVAPDNPKEIDLLHQISKAVVPLVEGNKIGTLKQSINNYDQVCQKLCAEYLLDKLKDGIGEGCCSKQLGRRLFSWVENKLAVPLSEKAILLWLTAMQCDACLPEESYKNTIEAFNANPLLHRAINGREIPSNQKRTTIYTKQCPICGAGGAPYYAAPLVTACNYVGLFEESKLWMQCDACKNLYAYNFPNLQQQDYTGCDSTAEEEPLTARFSAHIFCKVLNDIRRYCTGDSLLEVGIGNGDLMMVALEMGYTVEGVEISMKEAKKAQEQLHLTVHCCDFLQFNSEKQFDILTMGDVIEHVMEPLEALKKAHRLLKEGGILWLSTPNYDSAFSHYNGFKDPMWREPWHYTYFSRKTILPFLEQLNFKLLQYNVSDHYNGSMELILRKEG